MSAFEDFVNQELPRRLLMLKLANTGYSGDPNAFGAPVVIENAPQDTFYFCNSTNVLYIKDSSSSGTWPW